MMHDQFSVYSEALDASEKALIRLIELSAPALTDEENRSAKLAEFDRLIERCERHRARLYIIKERLQKKKKEFANLVKAPVFSSVGKLDSDKNGFWETTTVVFGDPTLATLDEIQNLCKNILALCTPPLK